MAQFVVRNLENDIHNKLRKLAQRHGHSLEEEVRLILRHAVKCRNLTPSRLGSRIAGRFAECGLDQDIAEQRGQSPQAASFE
jgi:plasmid stability protein